jgi:hypothetical protein
MAATDELLSTQDTPEVERLVMAAAALRFHGRTEHRGLKVDYEHGQWWVTCLDCRAQWSVVDAEGPGSTGGFDFEQVTDGEEESH